jgi:uncharacterized protein DUF2867
MWTSDETPPQQRAIVKVDSVEPDVSTGMLLTGAQFGDAFSITINNAALDARSAAEKMLGHSPRWITTLMALRDVLVTPFGLRTSSSNGFPANRIGIFPVLSETPARLIAGFDDKHLDFRVVVDVTPSRPDQRVTATTLVLTHNRLGRAYLAIILPFHRLIIRSMLQQVAVAS